MREACSDVIANFKSFIGNGWLMWLVFCIALVFCFFFWKEQRKKLVTISLLGCVVIINPIVYMIIGKRFMSGVYWRLFWALPIVIVVAAVLTYIVSKGKKAWIRMGTAFVLCIAIAVLGKSVINRGTYVMPENDYQIPQEAIDVSEVILEATGGVNTMIIVPDELFCYIRQYTAQISLAYGRNVWGFINTPVDWQIRLHDMMYAEDMDYSLLSDEARGYGCSYIVFDGIQKRLPEDIEEYGYKYIDTVAQYEIFELTE